MLEYIRETRPASKGKLAELSYLFAPFVIGQLVHRACRLG